MAALAPLAPPAQGLDPRAFRALAREEMGARFATPLAPARLAGQPFAFDLVSEDATLVGVILAPAKRATRTLSSRERAELSEAVLRLTLAPAQQRVLVVGRDREHLLPWLATYGQLLQDIELWHLRAPGDLERMRT